MKIQSSSFTHTEKCLKEAGKALENWFERGAKLLSLNEYPLRKLASRVAELSSLLIKGKRGNYMNDYLSAYFSFFFPQGFFRTYFVLCEMLHLLELDWESGLRVNDLGSGPGASLAAAKEALSGLRPKILGVEKSRPAKDFAEKLTGEEVREGDFTRTNLEGDLAILASSLSEVSHPLKIALRIWEKHKCMVVIEPGWAEGYSLIMRLGERIGPPLLPCGGYRCGLGGKDWCHGALPFSPPPLTQRINSLLRHKLRYTKFTYGVFCKGVYFKTWGIRLRSPVIREKGKNYFLACKEGKPIKIERLGRPEGEFKRANCCDLVEFEGMEISPGVYRVKDFRVKTLKELEK